MRMRVLLFAGLRESAGAREITVELPEGATVADLRARVAAGYPALAPLIDRVAVAINEEYAGAGRALHEGDVAALIPPVSGG